ncbi:hypothetical protein JW964_05995 [candidate division KSB1 bacterium]|nr:hypothetical protein [candidate division KSB1 bacterium]
MNVKPNFDEQSRPVRKITAIQKFQQFLLAPKTLIVLIIIMLLLLLEGLFDIGEIGLGRFIAWTNSYRPQTGPIWQREIKGETATQQLQEIEPLPEQKVFEVSNFNEVLNQLESNPDVRILKKNFLKIYTQLPYNIAQQIISPYELLKLIPEQSWTHCSISRDADELRIYFLDSENQLIRDNYFSMSGYIETTQSDEASGMLLEEQEEFQGRVVTRDDFLAAYNSLPLSTKIFVMNDPMQLIRWGDAMNYAAVSRYIVDGAVTIGFQVKTGISNTIIRYQASEIGAARLVESLNQVIRDKYLALPEKKLNSEAGL